MSTHEKAHEASAESTPASAPTSAAGRQLSPAELEQRRTAASLPRGPRSPEGKMASRLNATKHGLFASDAVNEKLEGRARAAEFDALLAMLRDDLAPVGALERLLVEEIAVCCWRLRRALRTECREAWVAEEEHRAGNPTIAAYAAVFGQEERFEAKSEREEELQDAKLDTLLIPPEGPAQSILRFEGSVKAHLHRALKTFIQLQDKRRARNAVAVPAAGDGASEKQSIAKPIEP